MSSENHYKQGIRSILDSINYLKAWKRWWAIKLFSFILSAC